MRDWLNQHRGVVVGIVALILVACGVLLWYGMRDARPDFPDNAFFYDVGTGKVFEAELGMVPPIAAPSGQTLPDGSPGGVKAYVYACGSCFDENARKIAYLERFTAEAQQRREELRQQYNVPIDHLPPQAWQQIRASPDDGRLVATAAAPDQWHEAASPAGLAIVGAAAPVCADGSPASPCFMRTGPG